MKLYPIYMPFGNQYPDTFTNEIVYLDSKTIQITTKRTDIITGWGQKLQFSHNLVELLNNEIIVGPSEENTKKIVVINRTTLENTQFKIKKNRFPDTFNLEIVKNIVNITRTDDNKKGWGQRLILEMETSHLEKKEKESLQIKKEEVISHSVDANLSITRNGIEFERID